MSFDPVTSNIIVGTFGAAAATGIIGLGLYYTFNKTKQILSDREFDRLREEQREKEANDTVQTTTNPLYKGSKRKTKKSKTLKRKIRR
jgi:hypothetical protein